MERQKKIIDASIIVKWFVNEDGTDLALSLRDEHINGESFLIVPELAFLEVINALRYKTKDLAALKEANDVLWELQLHVEKLNKFLLDRASEIALKNNLSLYDAVYLALARIYGSPLYTSDNQLAKCENVVKI